MNNRLVSESLPLAPSALATPRIALWKWAIAFSLLAALAINLDASLARFCRIDPAQGKSNIPGDVRKLLTISESFGHGAGVGIILLAVFVLDRPRRRQFPFLLLFPVVAGVASNVVKMLVARYRPSRFDPAAEISESFAGLFPIVSAELESVRFDWGVQSFPSGHTTTAVGLAIGLSLFYFHGRWLFVSLAILVAMQRIDAGAHWLSDTLAAAALACFTSYLLLRWTWLRARCAC